LEYSSRWSIDPISWHCAHPDGLVAYIDPEPTKSGGLRCLGPFVGKCVEDSSVKDAMRDLSFTIEQRFGSSSHYTIWGSYEESSRYQEHEFPILGSSCGFLPHLSMRTELFENNRSAWNREWDFTSMGAIHKSGLIFGGKISKERSMDLAAMHPTTILLNQTMMSLFVETVIPLRSPFTKTTGLMSLNWTPWNEQIAL
jgi:hypothetical protein